MKGVKGSAGWHGRRRARWGVRPSADAQPHIRRGASPYRFSLGRRANDGVGTSGMQFGRGGSRRRGGAAVRHLPCGGAGTTRRRARTSQSTTPSCTSSNYPCLHASNSIFSKRTPKPLVRKVVEETSTYNFHKGWRMF
jgi:hypothetical protein